MRAEYLTLKEMAAAMRVTVGTVRNLARGYYDAGTGPRKYQDQSRFPQVFKAGGKWLAKKADFERWLASR